MGCMSLAMFSSQKELEFTPSRDTLAVPSATATMLPSYHLAATDWSASQILTAVEQAA